MSPWLAYGMSIGPNATDAVAWHQGRGFRRLTPPQLAYDHADRGCLTGRLCARCGPACAPDAGRRVRPMRGVASRVGDSKMPRGTVLGICRLSKLWHQVLWVVAPPGRKNIRGADGARNGVCPPLSGHPCASSTGRPHSPARNSAAAFLDVVRAKPARLLSAVGSRTKAWQAPLSGRAHVGRRSRPGRGAGPRPAASCRRLVSGG